MSSLIEIRATTHGDYTKTAAFSQKLKAEMRCEPGWDNLSTRQRESLDLIAMKIARILCGDPNHADHWADIGGYAELAKPVSPQPAT